MTEDKTHLSTWENSLQVKHENPPDTGPVVLPTYFDVFAQSGPDIRRAREKNPQSFYTDGDIQIMMKDCLEEIRRLEEAARNSNKWNIPKDFADKNPLIVRFSAPGNYYHPEKDDKYKGEGWAEDSDRTLDDIAARFAAVMNGKRAGHNYIPFAEDRMLSGHENHLNPLRNSLLNDMKTDAGVKLLYIGKKSDEADPVRRALHTRLSFIPVENVEIIDNNRVVDTISQIRELADHLKRHPEQKDVVIVDFGSRLMRQSRIMEQLKDEFPPDVRFHFFSVATPDIKNSQYPLWETRGTAYLIITNQAATKPISYSIL